MDIHVHDGDWSAVVLPVFGVVFAAFCVWLAVRIVNRREKWAKWTLAAMAIGMPTTYVLSFGPACWWLATERPKVSRPEFIDGKAPTFYWPIGWMAANGPQPCQRVLRWYATIGIKSIYLPVNPGGRSWHAVERQPIDWESDENDEGDEPSEGE